MSTKYDDYDGDMYGSDTAPALEVQMDLEKAQTTETDIEVLVSTNCPPLVLYSRGLRMGIGPTCTHMLASVPITILT
jgi:hypothetical protein